MDDSQAVGQPAPETTVYFVRHAESDVRCHDDQMRPLTAKGLQDRALVTAFLADKGVKGVFSSPFKRAVDTIQPFAAAQGLPVRLESAFCERRVADEHWIANFAAFARRQWDDFAYHLPGGESLGEVQSRNVAALQRLLQLYEGQVLVVGSHGTALSAIIHYYDCSYRFADFERIKRIMPWVVRFTFEGEQCRRIVAFDLLHQQMETILG